MCVYNHSLSLLMSKHLTNNYIILNVYFQKELIDAKNAESGGTKQGGDNKQEKQGDDKKEGGGGRMAARERRKKEAEERRKAKGKFTIIRAIM